MENHTPLHWETESKKEEGGKKVKLFPILGIISGLISLQWAIFGIAAIILGIQSIKKNKLGIRKYKILAKVAIVLGVIGIAFAVFQSIKLTYNLQSQQQEIKRLQESESETAEWETFRNQPMGFTIKYPKEWVWTFSPLYKDDENARAMQLDKAEPYCTILFVKSTPTDRNTGEELVFKDLVASEKQAVMQLPIDNPKAAVGELIEEEITIDGIQSTKLSYLFFTDKTANSQGQQIHRIFIPLEGNKTFQIGYYAGSEAYDCQSEFTQMLSTFQFTEAEEPHIKVISPNGGEEWKIGDAYDIKWESSGAEKIDIDLYGPIPGQKPFSKRLATRIPASLGKYSWTISEDVLSGNSFEIIISQEGEVYSMDESDDYFSIVK